MSLILAAIVVITNLGYNVAFDTLMRNPSWVTYSLSPAKVVKQPRIHFSFKRDPRVTNTDNNRDYANSGYDRGHMAPAADFNWNTNALQETYYFSNITPQLPEVNRGIWLDIENEVRKLASSGEVNIITFPYGYSTNRIGQVYVPAKFVKIAYGYFGVRYWVVDNSAAPVAPD